MLISLGQAAMQGLSSCALLCVLHEEKLHWPGLAPSKRSKLLKGISAKSISDAVWLL